MDQRDTLIGEDIVSKKGVLNVSYPIQNGRIIDWDAMEKIWQYCYFDRLKVTSEEHPVLLTEIPMNDRESREQMIQIFFESFNVPAFFVQMQPVLSLYASGNTTGIILDCGEGVTHIVPIYEGYCLRHAISKSRLAGKDLTAFMKQLLFRAGQSFS